MEGVRMSKPHNEATKFQAYYAVWRDLHGYDEAAKWLAATCGSLSARVAILENQIKAIEKIVKQTTSKP